MNKWHTKECTKQYIELLEAIIAQRFFLAHNFHLIVQAEFKNITFVRILIQVLEYVIVVLTLQHDLSHV